MAIPTSDVMGYAKGVGAITDAFTAYTSAQLQKSAYMHEAAMTELRAKQIGIETQFAMADKQEELAKTLAMQNVMAAASGRKGGGSLSNIAQTSIQNLGKEEQKMLRTGKARGVGLMMEASGQRAAGQSAATLGLMGALSGLGTDLYEASQYMTPSKNKKVIE